MVQNKDIHLTSICFLGSDESIIEFNETLVGYLINARQKISDDSLPIVLSLKATLGNNVSGIGRDDLKYGINLLNEYRISSFFEYWQSGPTRTMYGSLFDNGLIASGFRSSCTLDFDQFPTHRNLDNIMELDEIVHKNGSVLGVGSRSVPIKLSYNDENGYLRRIFEGIINLTIGRGTINSSNNEGIVDGAYRDHGDRVTGAYLFNCSKASKASYVDNLIERSRKAGFHFFEDEYFMVFLASRTEGLSNLVFTSVENPYDPVELSEEKNSIIENHIHSPIRKISQIDLMRREIMSAVNDEYGGNGTLGQHYPVLQINEVCGYINESL